jgi:YD repeat-containing protein
MLEIKSSNPLITNQIDSIKTGDVMRGLLISVSVIALMMPSSINATETVTYSYDAQGRLVQSVISGTVNNGQTSTTTFDGANNRTNYSVSVNGGTSPPSPPPPPPPPSSNQPPVSVADATLSVVCNGNGVRNVLGNDSDPEGDLPLSMSLSGGTGLSYVAQEGAQSIRFYAPPTRNTGYTVSYVITDARGATTSATLSLYVTGSVAQCGGGVQQSGTPPPDPSGTADGG